MASIPLGSAFRGFLLRAVGTGDTRSVFQQETNPCGASIAATRHSERRRRPGRVSRGSRATSVQPVRKWRSSHLGRTAAGSSVRVVRCGSEPIGVSCQVLRCGRRKVLGAGWELVGSDPILAPGPSAPPSAFDLRDQLTSSALSSSARSLTRSWAGALESEVRDGVTAWQADRAGTPAVQSVAVATTSGEGPLELDWDGRGQLRGDGARLALDWTPDGLIAVASDSDTKDTEHRVYDALGRLVRVRSDRVASGEANHVIDFVYDGISVVEEHAGDDTGWCGRRTWYLAEGLNQAWGGRGLRARRGGMDGAPARRPAGGVRRLRVRRCPSVCPLAGPPRRRAARRRRVRRRRRGLRLRRVRRLRRGLRRRRGVRRIRRLPLTRGQPHSLRRRSAATRVGLPPPRRKGRRGGPDTGPTPRPPRCGLPRVKDQGRVGTAPTRPQVP